MSTMKPKLPPELEWKIVGVLLIIVALVISKESDASFIMALF